MLLLTLITCFITSEATSESEIHSHLNFFWEQLKRPMTLQHDMTLQDTLLNDGVLE